MCCEGSEAAQGDARDVSVSLDNVARLRQRTDPGAALALHEESLTIRRGLAKAMPTNLDAQSDLVVSLFSLASLLDESGTSLPAPELAATATRHWTEACDLMRALDAHGHVPPGWDEFLHIACEKAAR